MTFWGFDWLLHVVETLTHSSFSLFLSPGYLFENDSRVVPEKFEGEPSPLSPPDSLGDGCCALAGLVSCDVSHGAVGERLA